MAAFSYQHHQSLFLDPAYLPSNPIHIAPAPQQPGDLTIYSSPFFPSHHSHDAITEISANDVRAYESSSSLDTTTRVTSSDHHKVKLIEEVPTTQNSMDKKRKNSKQMVSSTSAVSNDSKEGKRTKQKKSGNGMKDAEKRPVSNEGEEKQKQQPPTGYIHVRARRGQATDSHSLAERVRREKISERMKLLQGLVPGCDQVIGKALMLDEIINYVQSLQNQVEFLSMKLASVSPTLSEFGLDLDDYMVQAQEMEGMPPPVPSVQQTAQTAHIQPTAFVETTDNCPMVDTSVPFLLHGQGPNGHSQEQDSFAMHVDGQSQWFLHQFQFNNMCSFQ